MRWQLSVVGIAGGTLLVVACSSGAEPVDDDGDGLGGFGGAKAPDVTKLCEEQCAPLHPTGDPDYRASRSCVLCDACYTVCSAEGVDVSACPAAPMPDACSATAATCAECVAGACAQLQDPATTMFTGICAAQGDTCANNVDCVGMTNCVRGCVEQSAPPM